MTELVDRVLGRQITPELPAIKYGGNMELEARRNYTQTMLHRGHKNLSVRECGLFVHTDYVHLAASPNGVVHCQCCGTGLLDIKCPFSLAVDQEPPSTLHSLQ